MVESFSGLVGLHTSIHTEVMLAMTAGSAFRRQVGACRSSWHSARACSLRCARLGIMSNLHPGHLLI